MTKERDDLKVEEPKELTQFARWVWLNQHKLEDSYKDAALSIINANLKEWIPSISKYDKDTDRIRLAWKSASKMQPSNQYAKISPETICYRAIQAARESDPPNIEQVCKLLSEFIQKYPESGFSVELNKQFNGLFKKPDVDIEVVLQAEAKDRERLLDEQELSWGQLTEGFQAMQDKLKRSAEAKKHPTPETRQPKPEGKPLSNSSQATENDNKCWLSLDKKTAVSLSHSKLGTTFPYVIAEYKVGNEITKARIYPTGRVSNTDGSQDFSLNHPISMLTGKLLQQNEKLPDNCKAIVEKAIANQIIQQYEKALGFGLFALTSSTTDAIIQELKKFTKPEPQERGLEAILSSVKNEGRLHNILNEMGLIKSKTPTLEKKQAADSGPKNSM